MAVSIPRLLKAKSETAAKFFFNLDKYNRYGLYHDDLIGGYNVTVNPAVAEAYRRLAIDQPKLHDQRVYRSLRASQLKVQKTFLPAEEWTTYEEDIEKGRYLQPYLEQIAKEEEEKKAFAAMNAQL